MKWRITLRCGCIWRQDATPDLRYPILCPTDVHGLVSIMLAERVEAS